MISLKDSERNVSLKQWHEEVTSVLLSVASDIFRDLRSYSEDDLIACEAQNRRGGQAILNAITLSDTDYLIACERLAITDYRAGSFEKLAVMRLRYLVGMKVQQSQDNREVEE
jgi:hypothetical protein